MDRVREDVTLGDMTEGATARVADARGRGARRRRAVAGMVGAVLLTVGACASPDAPRESARGKLRADVAFVGVADATGLERARRHADALSRLGAELAGLAPGENTVVSPVSIMLAFAMLREGASGETAAQLDAMFGLDAQNPGASVAALRAVLAEHDGDVGDVDRDEPPDVPLLHVADAAFVAPGAGVTDEFLDRIARFHDAGVSEVDFLGGAAKAALDEWVDRETGGLIDEAPSDPHPDTILTLLNAVVFAARWATEFDASETSDAEFTTADGRAVTVDMMRGSFEVPLAQQDGWQAAVLPYSADFAMIVALGDDAPLDAATWEAVRTELDAAGPVRIAVSMPRWELESNLDLKEVLPPLGLDLPFLPTGDLDGIARDAYVDTAAHATTITVAEKGTVAAAVTQLGVRVTSAPAPPELEIRLDRPFDFQIVHVATMLPVFAGHVADPSDG